MPQGWVHRAICGFASAAMIAGCSATSPHAKPPSILLAAGSGQQDTIGVTLPQALVVQVASSPAGGTNVGQVVQFSMIQPSGPGTAYAYVSSLANPNPATVVVDSTDKTGRASVQIVLGTVTGVAKVQIAVPELGYLDTASFTVLPGKAVSVAVTPADTLLGIGKQVTLHGASLDRAGNKRPGDSVTYSVRYGGVTLSGSVVTTTTAGLASVVGAVGMATDSGLISVVPAGTLAAISDTGGVIMFNLDGTGFRAITRIPATDVKWAPSGTAMVFVCPRGNGVMPLCTSDLNGVVTTLDLSDTTADAWPFYSRDGAWIYYSRINDRRGGIIDRIHPDGSLADTVHSVNPGDDYWASPSPDGSTLAYVELGAGNLRKLTIATGAVVDLGIVAHSPAWSPNSDVIAYLASDGGSGAIGLAHSDGSGQRELGTALNQYDFDIDWSPDGQWIVGRNAFTARIDLINVTTGQIMPLTFTGLVGSPAWQPGSGTGASAAVLRRMRAGGRANSGARGVVTR
jgi:Tol biopolymer transport system component